MGKTSSKKSLLDAYQFDRFKTSAIARGRVGDKNARVLSLFRRSKKVSVINVANFIGAITTACRRRFAISPVVTVESTLSLKPVGFSVRKPA